MAKESSTNLLWDQKRQKTIVSQLLAVAMAEFYKYRGKHLSQNSGSS